MPNFYHNKVIWITGASSGIGKALAMALAQHAVKLVISARDSDALEKVKQEIISNNKTEVFILPFDLVDINNFQTYTNAVINKFGRIDILINNGGISQRSYISETPLAIDRKLMEVNYFANVALTKQVLPLMISQKSGHIIVISSLSGKFGFYLRSAYAASKHALHGFYETLRLEQYNNNIKVILVCPGFIKTDISLHAINKYGEPQNAMDANQANGVSANECAQKILEGVVANKRELLIGGKEILPAYIKRFFPSLFFAMMRKLNPKK